MVLFCAVTLVVFSPLFCWLAQFNCKARALIIQGWSTSCPHEEVATKEDRAKGRRMSPLWRMFFMWCLSYWRSNNSYSERIENIDIHQCKWLKHFKFTNQQRSLHRKNYFSCFQYFMSYINTNVFSCGSLQFIIESAAMLEIYERHVPQNVKLKFEKLWSAKL